MKEFPTQTAISALRAVFWGGLLCVFDFSFSQTANGNGFKVDIISDVIGCLMIVWGVGQLKPLLPLERYYQAMMFVQVIAWMCVVEAVADHWVTKTPIVPGIVRSLFSLASLAAIVCFCVAMRWLCESLSLSRARQSWRITTYLFVFIYLLPLGLFHTSAIIAIITGRSFHFNLGPAGLLFLLVFVVPIIHLFMSTSRMKEELQRLYPWSTL
jgi:hypothetical protein